MAASDRCGSRDRKLSLILNYKHKPERADGMPSVFEHPKPTAADITPQARPHLLSLLNCTINWEPKALRAISFTQTQT